MKHKLKLDDLGDAYEGWGFVLFRCPLPNYIFADIINGLYNLQLARLDDMDIDGTPWPLFSYADKSIRHISVHLVERPQAATAAPWNVGNKLLIVKGEDAQLIAEAIYDEFTSPITFDETDLLAREHAQLLDELLAGFTIATILDPQNAGLTRKAQKEHALAMQHCDRILDYIEEHHLGFES